MKVRCLIGVMLVCFFTCAQQPSFSVFGENQFKGIQIYDVIQDNDLNYWFATNEGLFLYDNIRFDRIECEEAKSASLFSFVKDSNGDIFCHNLNQQVFRIHKKRLELFYEIPQKDIGLDVSLHITKKGELAVVTEAVAIFRPGSRSVHLKKMLNHYIGPGFDIRSDQTIFHIGHTDSIVIYSKDKFIVRKMKGVVPKPNHEVLRFFRLDHKIYALDHVNKKCYLFNDQTFSLTPAPKDSAFFRTGYARLYNTKFGLWVASSLPGICLKKISNPGKMRILYPEYFISDVFVDAEGNLLLSTFDQGVLVISDLRVPGVIHSFQSDPVTTMYSDDKQGLFLGTSKGKILNYYGGKITTISPEGRRPIDVLLGIEGSDYLISDNGSIRMFDKRTGKVNKNEVLDELLDWSLKSGVQASSTEIYLGTNRGVFKLEVKGNEVIRLKRISGLSNRVHHMAYDKKRRLLFVSTSSGTFVRDEEGGLKVLRYKGKDLFPTYMYAYQNAVYINTGEKGILVYSDKIPVRRIIPRIHGKICKLKKIQRLGDSFIGISLSGIYQFDLNGRMIKSIHSIFGFSSKRVLDFTIHDNILWVSHTNGVQKIDLSYIDKTKHRPVVKISAIQVNNKPLIRNQQQSFSSDQNKWMIEFTSPTLRNYETIRYHYRLKGGGDEWSISEPGSHQVVYSSLSPSHYVFELKSENNGMFSDTISYAFVIESPVYMRWWFLSLCVLFLIGIIYVVYRWQLSIQRKKSEQINELNASRLTAIQSQMNPHFIFNSLNSIQDLILKGDVEHSYSYITTFSNLVRRTLNYSDKDFIDFEQEVKLLELYLSLEKLRFKKDFDYRIEANELEDIMIPPLLIQPFVENALIHGLLHKEGEKRLKIVFRLEEQLICIIEDNGIGREAAKAIRQRQRADHESFSGKAIQRRFKILSEVFSGSFGYHYEDLQEKGVSIGTRVVLRLPVQRKF